MIYKFKKDKQILNPNLFDNEIVFIEENLNSYKNYKELAELLVFCKALNITFGKNSHILAKLSKESINYLKITLSPKVGVTFFNLNNEYNINEFVRTILEYMKTYNRVEIPDELFINFPETKLPKVNKEYSFVTPQVYFEELTKILANTGNPGKKEIDFLNETYNLEILNVNTIENRNNIKLLSQSISNFQFKAKDTAQLREFISSLSKIRTCNKTFIMKTLNNFNKGEVLSDFNANKSFWKHLEHNLKPTQKKYKQYRNARSFFKHLKDNDLKESYNSQVERSFKTLSLLEFYEFCSLKKSPQYAVRNLTKYLKQNKVSEDELISLVKIFKKQKVKTKVLIELYRGLTKQSKERVFKIKNKFHFDYLGKPKTYTFFAEQIKDLIIKKLLKDAETFLNNTKDVKYEVPAISRNIEDLKNVPFPVSTDNFFKNEKIGYITRGTKLKLSDYVNGDYIVFIAWRKKDFQRGRVDLDLSGIEVLNDNLENLEYNGSNYQTLKSKNMKHSGDFTSCKEFNPLTGLITCEAILVKSGANNLHFCLNTYNDISMKELDVFAGICGAENFKGIEETGTLDIEKTKLLFEVSHDFTGFYKLFSIKDGEIMLEGVNVCEHSYTSVYSEAYSIVASSKYLEKFDCLNVYDFVEKLGINIYNPYKLKILLDYIINC